MSDKKYAIEVKGLSKSFRLPTEKSNNLKQTFVNWTRGVKGYKEQKVLKNISFNIEQGDFFGIVGRNGSGKSTLLKLLAGIYEPDKGSIKTHGKIVPFIELGVGFNPELTGRENVYLNGALLGFSTKEIDVMYDEIVDFAELHEFMNQKLKNYSSGMQVRLAFSIAIKAQGDILILDEVLAVGDEAFQRKCNDYFYSQQKSKKTIVLVTHSMNAVRQFCNKAVLIDDGKIIFSGNPDKVASKYSKIFEDELAKKRNEEMQKTESDTKKYQYGDIKLKNIEVLQRGKPSKVIKFREDFTVEVTMIAKKDYEDLLMGLPIIDQVGRPIVTLSTKLLSKFNLKKGESKIIFNVQNVLREGDYYFNIAIQQNSDGNILIRNQELSLFTVLGMDTSKYSSYSMTHPDFKVRVK